ncbi:hypothetical protein RN001_006631 [Aquatica leii]|uniref:Uncharacterized protein n=1 Tax=Aquatica leii TaxID=1421715 RepID=A0AAN7Q5M7_9COLE|nr:hypothetical protein RN001_006631 [Aquatica leii]
MGLKLHVKSTMVTVTTLVDGGGPATKECGGGVVTETIAQRRGAADRRFAAAAKEGGGRRLQRVLRRQRRPQGANTAVGGVRRGRRFPGRQRLRRTDQRRRDGGTSGDVDLVAGGDVVVTGVTLRQRRAREAGAEHPVSSVH